MIRISVTGPESTGKSWLAKHLAEHYQTQWVPEYARKYLKEINRPYDYNDILNIAQKQFESENQAEATTEFLFCDTDFCVTSIWCNVKYEKCHDWITAKLEQNTYSLYLLCDIDLPWQYDPLREHPHERQYLFDLYLNELNNRMFPFAVVRGTGPDRLANAIKIIESHPF